MDTTTYAVVGMLNSVAYDPRAAVPLIAEPEFESFNLAQLFSKRGETLNSAPRSGDYHGNVSDALAA